MKLARTNEITAETMRELFTVQTFSQTTDGEGGFTYAVTSTADYWGDISPLSQSRALLEMSISFKKAVRIYTRYTTGITVDNKILFDGETYTIHSILDIDTKKQYLKIIAYV